MSDKPESDSEVVDGGEEYMLGRNLSASARLNYQFFLWKDTLGFNIHPSIPLPDDEFYIGDLATGTGIWLIDVSRDYRKAYLDGFDISLEQVPQKEWFPPNMTLSTWNVYDEIPKDTVEKYDLIHLRLLGLAVRNGETGIVFENVFKMLNPGGYVQWDELNEAHASVKTINPSIKAPALEELIGDSYARTKYNWPLQLAESAKAVGFEDARIYHFEDRSEMSRAQAELAMMFFQEYASRLEPSGQTEEAVYYRDLLKIAAQETLDGSALLVPKVVCVARKPQEATPDENTREK